MKPYLGILKTPPTKQARDYYDGDSMASVLTDIGAPCECVKTVLSPQIVTYHFELADPTQTNHLSRYVKPLEAITHETITVTRSDVGHFALIFPIEREIAYLRDVAGSSEAEAGRRRVRLYASLGVDLDNKPLGIDLAKMPHLLIAGATGSGKSVLLNSIISSLLFNVTPKECQFLMIDPKQVELSVYDGLPHLPVPVARSHEDALKHLKGACAFMDSRYKLLAEKGYRNAQEAGWSSLVIVIDELADLMLTSRYECEEHIVRLAQLGRAAGIHLIIATQRPTVNVVTGLIKSNIPAKIALQTSSIRDSINILDHKGAETLTGKGDALLKLPDRVREIRFQSAYIDTDDIERIVKFWQK